MANYKYAARDAAGNKVEGAIAAKSEQEAIAEIRKRGLSLLNIASSGEENKATPGCNLAAWFRLSSLSSQIPPSSQFETPLKFLARFGPQYPKPITHTLQAIVLS